MWPVGVLQDRCSDPPWLEKSRLTTATQTSERLSDRAFDQHFLVARYAKSSAVGDNCPLE